MSLDLVFSLFSSKNKMYRTCSLSDHFLFFISISSEEADLGWEGSWEASSCLGDICSSMLCWRIISIAFC